MLHARTTAGDVARLDAMIGHLADLLGRAGDPHDLQRRRATALGLLANPALACVYLTGSLQQTPGVTGAVPADDPVEGQAPPQLAVDAALAEDHGESDRSEADEAAANARGEIQESQEVEDAAEIKDVEPAGPVAAARVLGEALRSLGVAALTRLRPRTVLYLHLAEEAVTTAPGCGSQVVRSEGLGALTRQQLQEWLGADQVVVRPVIDLHGQEPVDAYEVPSHLREAMVLASPFEVFPYGTTPSRSRLSTPTTPRPGSHPRTAAHLARPDSTTSGRWPAGTTGPRPSAGSPATSPCPGSTCGARRPVTGTAWTTRHHLSWPRHPRPHRPSPGPTRRPRTDTPASPH